jgi:hypothetical protein
VTTLWRNPDSSEACTPLILLHSSAGRQHRLLTPLHFRDVLAVSGMMNHVATTRKNDRPAKKKQVFKPQLSELAEII